MQIPFSASPRASLGVEWELMLVDRTTRQLRGAASPVLEQLGRPFGGEHPRAKHELLECCIELVTGVCQTVAEARRDLAGTVEELRPLLDELGLGLMGSGTHPISDWQGQQVSPLPRYAQLIEDMQWLARRLQIFGVHVHVGVRSPAKVIPIVNALTAYVPHFLALSASSPYWVGIDTGLASARSKVFEALPTAGLPHQLEDWGRFEAFMDTLIASGTITSIKEVWWDIRPHPTYGTVELRICDGMATLDEVATVAALSQCLVEQLDSQLDKGYTLPTPTSWVVRENKWRAARYGLEASVLVDDSGATAPVRDLIAELAHDLRPVAERLGCSDELDGVGRLLEAGAGSARQRAVAAAAGGSLEAVVDSLLAEFETGHP